jgi:hypothetical protein
MAEKHYDEMSASEKKKEDWMNTKWRPMMGWMYMVTCITDFVVFPILWSALQAFLGHPVSQWNPLTLQGAGLFHVAMGAVLGLAAWGRTQEKMAGANNGGLQSQATSMPTTFSSASSGGFQQTSSFSSPAPSSFGGGFQQASFNEPAPIRMSASGKPMPVLEDTREI